MCFSSSVDTNRRGLVLDLFVACALLSSVAATGEARSLPPAQRAGDGLKQLSREDLGNVEVTTASKMPEEARRVPAAIFVISHDDIQRSGATTFPEVLRLVPGVGVARIDSDHWSVGVRGFGDRFSKSVLVLIDGRSVYTPLFAGVFWSVQDTLLEDVERIEVIRGPGGAIWGANAANGVINIVTKSANDRYVSALPARQVDAYGALDLRIACRLNTHVEWSVAGQNLSHDVHKELAHDPQPPVAICRTVSAMITWRR